MKKVTVHDFKIGDEVLVVATAKFSYVGHQEKSSFGSYYTVYRRKASAQKVRPPRRACVVGAAKRYLGTRDYIGDEEGYAFTKEGKALELVRLRYSTFGAEYLAFPEDIMRVEK